MRLLLSLLFGAITCAAQQPGVQMGGYGFPMWWQPAAPETPSRQTTGSGSNDPQVFYSAHTGGAAVGQASPGVPQTSTQDGQQVTEGGWSSPDTSGQDEPVFTPVSEEDQVYAHKSRSRYNVARLMSSRFTYTPTETLNPQDPVYPYHQKDGGRPRQRHVKA